MPATLTATSSRPCSTPGSHQVGDLGLLRRRSTPGEHLHPRRGRFRGGLETFGVDVGEGQVPSDASRSPWRPCMPDAAVIRTTLSAKRSTWSPLADPAAVPVDRWSTDPPSRRDVRS